MCIHDIYCKTVYTIAIVTIFSVMFNSDERCVRCWFKYYYITTGEDLRDFSVHLYWISNRYKWLCANIGVFGRHEKKRIRCVVAVGDRVILTQYDQLQTLALCEVEVYGDPCKWISYQAKMPTNLWIIGKCPRSQASCTRALYISYFLFRFALWPYFNIKYFILNVRIVEVWMYLQWMYP